MTRRCCLPKSSAILSLALLLGCGAKEQVRWKQLPSPVTSVVQEELSKALRESAIDEKEGIVYRVGPGDSLLVTVFRHPEFTIIPFTAAANIKPGVVVDNDGTIQFPLLGSLQVGGKTMEEIRQLLESGLAHFVPEPKVTVQVLFNGSVRYYLLGEFAQPGMKLSDRPLSLLETLALGGSINLAHADLRGAYIARNGRKLPINIYCLLRKGDLRQNIRLRSGDTVFVPDNLNELVFVFGGPNKGTSVPLVNGNLSLVQALAAAGMGYQDHSQGKFESVRILRGDGDHAEFFVVNAERILRGEALPFMLESGDLIFVPETRWTSWNQILQQFLPSLQTIDGLLAPFVQIKYLGGL